MEFLHLNFVLAGLSTLFTGWFTYYTFKIYKLRQKYKHIPGPPANGLFRFYFGNVFEILANQKNNKVTTDLELEWYFN